MSSTGLRRVNPALPLSEIYGLAADQFFWHIRNQNYFGVYRESHEVLRSSNVVAAVPLTTVMVMMSPSML